MELSIVMPCLNEAETLATCIQKAHCGAVDADVKDYEIIVADNGSTDGSREIAQQEGAQVVDAPVKGYGAALKCGIAAAKGKYVIMGDADDSYDFSSIKDFVEQLRRGNELVMGTRIKGEIKPGAMPVLHRYLGNPVLTFLGNLFYRCGLSDFHCGLRGFNRESVLGLGLRTDGMEFASELVIRATLNGLSRTEVPITLSRDGRTRKPHLRTWRDGWRHLRFMLLYSPRWLFFYPGALSAVIGFVICIGLMKGPLTIGNITFDVHTLMAGMTMIVVGWILMSMAVFVRLYASRVGLLKRRDWLENMIDKFSLEYGLIIGACLMLVGIGLYGFGVFVWGKTDFGPLDYQETLRVIIPGTVFIIIGVQVFFSSFIISLLGIRMH